ncbi:MAG: 5-oxoprolinase subunit PxpB [Chitinophagaceae bacterium]
MKPIAHTYQIFPLGDSAMTIDYGNIINESINREVIQRAKQLKNNLTAVNEIIPAYSSLTIFFDLLKIKKLAPHGILVFDYLKEWVDQLLQQPLEQESNEERFMKIPVCYAEGFSKDLEEVAFSKKISREEVTSIHYSKIYRVYMLGFLPGFSYMGVLSDSIAMPRKSHPQHVAAGSVGIAGNQTGIYPMATPGGWQIIGRTPLKLFEAGAVEPSLFRAGDSVQFFPISKSDFYEVQNSSLSPEGDRG